MIAIVRRGLQFDHLVRHSTGDGVTVFIRNSDRALVVLIYCNCIAVLAIEMQIASGMVMGIRFVFGIAGVMQSAIEHFMVFGVISAASIVAILLAGEKAMVHLAAIILLILYKRIGMVRIGAYSVILGVVARRTRIMVAADGFRMKCGVSADTCTAAGADGVVGFLIVVCADIMIAAGGLIVVARCTGIMATGGHIVVARRTRIVVAAGGQRIVVARYTFIMAAGEPGSVGFRCTKVRVVDLLPAMAAAFIEKIHGGVGNYGITV